MTEPCERRESKRDGEFTDSLTVTRGEVYQGLLAAMGNYRPVWVQNTSTGEVFHALDEGALKQAVSWVVSGDSVTVLTHHVWGVGGGPTEEFTYTRWKHRHVRWNTNALDEGWVSETEPQTYGED